jgi:iron complex outermembrane recepter protein
LHLIFVILKLQISMVSPFYCNTLKTNLFQMRKNYTFKHLRILCLTLTLLIVNVLVVVAQDVAVSGKVTGPDGAGIPGVSVYQKGKISIGVSTDATGSYKIAVASGSTLIFSSIGMKSQEIVVGNQSAINVTMSEDVSNLSDVFITATSQPVRKIKTVTAVESIGAKQLARINPINIVDAIRYVPGVYVQTQAGRVRNSIFMRGFPDVSGNGLGYTSLLYDGLRTFASPEAVPDASFRYDMNIDRIEVVRGSAATLYGRGAAAGAVNVISRTSGEERV